MIAEKIARAADHCVVPAWSIKTSPVDGRRYVVFKNSTKAYLWKWLFVNQLGLRISCFGEYENAYGPF